MNKKEFFFTKCIHDGKKVRKDKHHLSHDYLKQIWERRIGHFTFIFKEE
jgi:hypothetical protein